MSGGLWNLMRPFRGLENVSKPVVLVVFLTVHRATSNIPS